VIRSASRTLIAAAIAAALPAWSACRGATILDQRYNLTSDGACAGIPNGLCNGDGGLLAQPNTTNPKGVIANPRASATNPDFLKDGIGTQFTLPRSLRIGVRLTF